MPRPTLTAGSVEASLIQKTARVRLQVVHDSLRRDIGVNDDVDVIRSDVSGNQAPPTS